MPRTLLAALLLVACDDSDSTSPADRCRDFIDVACTRSIACGETTTDHRTCFATAEAQLTSGRGCGVVRAIRDERELDSCLAQLQAMTCDELLSLGPDDFPPECQSQLLMPP